ncbi:hypothetical protein [Mesorhizobium sp. IMUNJ 23232]|uniref:hypothetical protein n=1 Tax=Mesorhizobium sp. IMUNJ 23232 TaxID=3376064 RepID=UPI003787EF4F
MDKIRQLGEAIRDFSLVLFCIGIAGMIMVPGYVSEIFASRAAEWNAINSPLKDNLVRFDINQGDIGWLNVRFPETMRINQDAPLIAEYVANFRAWNRNQREVREYKIAVELEAPNLEINPTPLVHKYNIERLLDYGREEKIWTVEPKREGEFTLVVRFFATGGASIRPMRIHVNDTTTVNNNQVALGVKVNTIYHVPQWVVNVIKAAGVAFSAFLTLPFVKVLLETWIQRRYPSRDENAEGSKPNSDDSAASKQRDNKLKSRKPSKNIG